MSLPRLAPLGSPDPGPLSAAVAVARPFLTEASRLPDRIRDRDVHVPARIDGSRSTNGQFVAEGYRRYSVMPVGRVTVNLPSVPDFTFSTTWPVLSREVARAAESTSTNRMPRTQPSLSVTAETPVAPRAFAKRQHCRTHAMPDVVAPLVPTARAAPRRSMRRLGFVTPQRVGMPRHQCPRASTTQSGSVPWISERRRRLPVSSGSSKSGKVAPGTMSGLMVPPLQPPRSAPGRLVADSRCIYPARHGATP
jgi:hypothetical protein